MKGLEKMTKNLVYLSRLNQGPFAHRLPPHHEGHSLHLLRGRIPQEGGDETFSCSH